MGSFISKKATNDNSYGQSAFTTTRELKINHISSKRKEKKAKSELVNDVSPTHLSSTQEIEDKSIPFVPPINNGKVIHVYDGDTITITSKLPYKESPLYKFRVRLARIDSPEIKGDSTEEQHLARISKEYLESLVLNKIVYLENVSTDKYGRILADVYLQERVNNKVININVNDKMLASKHAIKYNGGSKKPFDVSDYL